MKILYFAALVSCVLINPALAKPSNNATLAIARAIADPLRPADDVKRDGARKPAAILEFAQIKPGDKAIDFIMGGGYFTRVIASTVGPKGRVYAYQPAEFIKFRAQYADEQNKVAGAYANVTPLNNSLGALNFPESVNFIFTAQNYHDLHLAAFPPGAVDAVNAVLFKTLKPGGVLLIIDHAAAAGSGARAADTLHRIDPATVRAELEKAGFKLEAESPLLRNPDDPHTQLVFDAAIRGETDQFVYRFRKPR